MAGNYSLDSTKTLIDGVEIKPFFNCEIEKSTGFIMQPTRKELWKNEWRDQNGSEIDLSEVYVKDRELNFTLLVKGFSYSNAVQNVQGLLNLIYKPGYRYVKRYGIHTCFLAFCKEEINPVQLKKSSALRPLFRVSIPLVEHFPVKTQYYADGTLEVAIEIVRTKPQIIDWGDNTYTNLAVGSSTEHKVYSTAGHYCISIIDGTGITSITATNATLLSELTVEEESVTADREDITADSMDWSADQM